MEPVPDEKLDGVSRSQLEVVAGKAFYNGRPLADWVDDVALRIFERSEASEIVVFGSVQRGDDGPDSDIDLLVVLDDAPVADRRRLMVDMRRATRAVAAPHDLLVTSVADLERHSATPGTTEYEPAQHGVVVYERVAA